MLQGEEKEGRKQRGEEGEWLRAKREERERSIIEAGGRAEHKAKKGRREGGLRRL